MFKFTSRHTHSVTLIIVIFSEIYVFCVCHFYLFFVVFCFVFCFVFKFSAFYFFFIIIIIITNSVFTMDAFVMCWSPPPLIISVARLVLNGNDYYRAWSQAQVGGRGCHVAPSSLLVLFVAVGSFLLQRIIHDS